MFESLRVSELKGSKRVLMRTPSSTRPSIYVVEREGTRAVVKDFSDHGFLYRNLIGRFLVWREEKAYRRLRGMKGIPTLYGVADGPALVMEAIPGESLEAAQRKRAVPAAFFDRLKKMVDEFHDRGVCHCDLKRAGNILVGEDGRPGVIDWSAAIFRSEFRFFPFTRIYRRFVIDDLNAVTKYRLHNCPETVSAEEEERYLGRSRLEKLLRTLRDRSRELLRRLA